MSYLESYCTLVLSLHQRGLDAPELTFPTIALLQAMLDRLAEWDAEHKKPEAQHG